MSEPSASGTFRALADFQRARRQETLQEVLHWLTGRPDELLPFDEVRRALQAESQIERGLQEIPLEAIVGSVGRYQDFNRDFLPRHDSLGERWARVKLAADGTGWPPIEVFQIGEAYFVQDGNHRVSVAQQLGMSHIQAYVTEVRTRVPLPPDIQADQLICKAQYAEFLERTRLDVARPEADLTLTVPEGYRLLDEHIAVHRHFLGVKLQREIPYDEAAARWHDSVYLPVVQVIRNQALLREFPDRTETDLYLWLSEHHSELQEALGWEVAPEAAAQDLASREAKKSRGVLAKVGDQLIDLVVPDELQAGPEPGEWRQQRLELRPTDQLLANRLFADRLFADILVPVSGQEVSWRALEQALVVAGREGSRVRGLHVLPEEAEEGSPELEALRLQFEQRGTEAGAQASLIFERGAVADTISDRARWNDLVVLSMAHPPGAKVAERLSSGLRKLVKDCPRPILAVPGEISPLQRALLAFDGSPKAEEALYVGAYLAVRWGVSLVVAVATTREPAESEPAWRARIYLEEHGVQATFVVQREEAAQVIQSAAADHDCDFYLMGGYGGGPVLEAVLGSTADLILRESDIPVLICQ